jgi:hypothetical protein
MKINQFSKQQIHTLSLEIQTALDNIKTKYELSELELEKVTFSETWFTAKISGKTQNYDEKKIEKDEAWFFAKRHGLPEDLLNCEFFLEEKVFNIIRIESKNTKYPIIAECKENGLCYKFPVAEIKHLLDKHRIINIDDPEQGAN